MIVSVADTVRHAHDSDIGLSMSEHHNPGAQLAGSVSQARRAVGWSQRELAERCGLSRPTIARIEAGQHVRMAVPVVARIHGGKPSAATGTRAWIEVPGRVLPWFLN